MDEQPQPVLSYEPQPPKRRRWTSFAAGMVVGVLAVVLALGFVWTRRSATPAVTSSSRIVVPLQPVTRPSLPPSFPFPQGEGKLLINERGVGVPYGKFVLFTAGDEGTIALRITCPSGDGRGIAYEWIHRPEEVTEFSSPNVKRGTGQAFEKGGSAWLDAGRLRIQWSSGNNKGGWLYWPGERHKGFRVETTTADDIEDFDEVLAEGEWAVDGGIIMGKLELDLKFKTVEKP